jgi:TonB family protein
LLILFLLATFLLCGRAYSQSDDPTSVWSQLKTFEKDGFGINSITNDRLGGGTSVTGESLIRSLSEKSQAPALSFLKLPACGIWSGAEVDNTYDQFVSSLNWHDRNSACYHFIQSLYNFGKEDYTAALQEINIACKNCPGVVPMLRFRALIFSKSGDTEAAKKSWEAANSLQSLNSVSPTVTPWINGVVQKFKSTWAERIKSQGNGNPVHPTIVILVTIDKIGEVTDVQITESSGDKKLDKLAQDACVDSSPVEPPPAGLVMPAKLRISFDKVLKRHDLTPVGF